MLAQLEGEALIEGTTKLTFHTYEDNKTQNQSPWLIKLRPYLTNHRLPSALKLPEGAIETLYPVGWCDNASRMQKFLLSRKSIQSRQWNIILPDAAHAALIVSTPSGPQYADPYYGVIQNEQGAYTPISKDSNIALYKNFDAAMMGPEGQPLTITAAIPALKTPLILGEINGDDRDLQGALNTQNMTPHFTYIGHRYDRGWTRILKPQSDVKVTFTLIDDFDPKALTSNIAPIINGKTLTWTLKANEPLIFEDAKARLSLKRFNSYIAIDQIRIEPWV